MTVYVIVEREVAKEILSKSLSDDVVASIKLIVANGYQYLSTIAASLLTQTSSPVLLICDAETRNVRLIEERRDWLGVNSRRFAGNRDRYRIVMAVPELESIVIDPGVLAEAYGREAPDTVLVKGHFAPREAIEEMNRLTGRSLSALDIVAGASSVSLEKMRHDATIREIEDFVRSAAATHSMEAAVAI